VTRSRSSSTPYWSTTKFSGALPARRVHELAERVERKLNLKLRLIWWFQ
jgi:hypothetical protein